MILCKFAAEINDLGRILAIDYGRKRVGVAVTDTEQLIATRLETVHSSEIINFLVKYIDKEDVDCIVVGEPKTLRNEKSESAKIIDPFVKHLTRKFPDIAIERMDERFTSKMAVQTLIDAGVKKKKRREKELVDGVSATLILQSYMQQKGI